VKDNLAPFSFFASQERHPVSVHDGHPGPGTFTFPLSLLATGLAALNADDVTDRPGSSALAGESYQQQPRCRHRTACPQLLSACTSDATPVPLEWHARLAESSAQPE